MSHWPFRLASAQDAHGKFADPLYLNVTTTPYIFDLASGSPALNKFGSQHRGRLGLCGKSSRKRHGQINMGAYEQ